jgi:hypothetical protein
MARGTSGPVLQGSPLLTAAGVSQQRLAAWRCDPHRIPWWRGWSGLRAVLLGPATVTCLGPPNALRAPGAVASGPREVTLLILDRRGRALHVGRTWEGLSAAAAATAADSAVGAGQRLPGARALTCASRFPVDPAAEWRGWRTEAYLATVRVQPARRPPTDAYRVRLEVGPPALSGCTPAQ